MLVCCLGFRLFPISHLAVLLPPAVALLPLLHDSVAAERRLGLGEAATRAPRLDVQHLLDRLEAARAEAAVVALVSGGGAREHDVVAVLAAGNARLVVLGVVLWGKGKEWEIVLFLVKPFL